MSKSLQTLSLCVALAATCVALVATLIPASTAQQNSAGDIKADSARDQRAHAGLQAGLASGAQQVRPSALAADGSPHVTWEDNPSLMDASWRQWPSVIDF